jgi:hypothetical protein
MRIKIVAGIITLSVLLASFTVMAQQNLTPLTNEDVRKMLNVKLTESIIATVIQLGPTHSTNPPRRW